MNNKHRKTLNKVFLKPTRANINWSSIESLLISLGAEMTEGHGSRVGFELNNVIAIFHRPHPGKETKKGAVEAVREFFIKAGIKNDGI